MLTLLEKVAHTRERAAYHFRERYNGDSMTRDHRLGVSGTARGWRLLVKHDCQTQCTDCGKLMPTRTEPCDCDFCGSPNVTSPYWS